MTVAIVTDSASALPAALADAYGITVVPIWIELDGRAVRDGEVPMREVLAAEKVTTSGPSPGEFATAAETALAGASAAVVLTVTAALSSTHAAARVGTEAFGDRVHVLDTGSAAGGQALVVLAAARASADGADLADVVRAAEEAAARVRVVGALASSARLARSGRVPDLAARAADRLGVRPMFELRHGRVRALRPARGEGDLGRVERLCLAEQPSGGRLHAVVMHADAADRADALCRRLRHDPASDVIVGPFGPAMAAHTGPGLLGLAWWWEPRSS
jgi:DegV family protein with EDD domain